MGEYGKNGVCETFRETLTSGGRETEDLVGVALSKYKYVVIHDSIQL